MKPFNLEKALAGAKCITRYGCEAYVKYREDDFGTYPLRGFYYIADDGHPTEARWTIDGYYNDSSNPHALDLCMAPKKRTVWVNIYLGGTSYWYSSEEEADKLGAPDRIGGKAYPVEVDDE